MLSTIIGIVGGCISLLYADNIMEKYKIPKEDQWKIRLGFFIGCAFAVMI